MNSFLMFNIFFIFLKIFFVIKIISIYLHHKHKLNNMEAYDFLSIVNLIKKYNVVGNNVKNAMGDKLAGFITRVLLIDKDTQNIPRVIHGAINIFYGHIYLSDKTNFKEVKLYDLEIELGKVYGEEYASFMHSVYFYNLDMTYAFNKLRMEFLIAKTSEALTSPEAILDIEKILKTLKNER